MNNWKTTIGGALSALGTSIAAIAAATAFTEPDYKKLAIYFLVCGGMLSAFGKFFALLFAQDKTTDAKQGSSAPAALPMIMLILMSLAIALPFLGTTGCTTPQQTVAYNTLYSVEKVTVGAYDGYIDSVLHKLSTTNGVPAVSKAFNRFQASFLVALDAAQFNTNAIAPLSLATESQDVLNVIATWRGK